MKKIQMNENVKNRMIQEADQTCSVCMQRLQPGWLVVHHNNRNRLDNSPENARVVCTKCHRELTSAQYKAGEIKPWNVGLRYARPDKEIEPWRFGVDQT